MRTALKMCPKQTEKCLIDILTLLAYPHNWHFHNNPLPLSSIFFLSVGVNKNCQISRNKAEEIYFQQGGGHLQPPWAADAWFIEVSERWREKTLLIQKFYSHPLSSYAKRSLSLWLCLCMSHRPRIHIEKDTQTHTYIIYHDEVYLLFLCRIFGRLCFVSFQSHSPSSVNQKASHKFGQIRIY